MNKNTKILMLDVETAGGFNEKLVYDLGVAVVLPNGEIIESHSFIIDEIFNNAGLMNSAYYAEKVPSYKAEIAQGMHEVVPFAFALNKVKELIYAYDLKIVSAYNLAFDLDAIWKTSKTLLGYNYGFKGLERLCIWSLACETIFQQTTYQKVAIRENWVSEAGNLKTSAEHAYRYITGDYKFVEQHKGLADVQIEAEIMAKCFRQKKKTISGIIQMPWKLVNTKAFKELRAGF
jgi:hypothetical protein